eukprot:SAG31_NODE_3274_length_4475_cov_4.879799_3_plen_390_part_00
MGWCKSLWINAVQPMLSFQTQRSIVLQDDLWQYGLVFRMFQGLAIAYIYWSFFGTGANTWAKHDIPDASVNSYAVPTAAYEASQVNFTSGLVRPAYCNNQTYAFSALPPPYWWQFDAPECKAMDWQELFQKDPDGGVYISTTMIEESTIGYPPQTWTNSDGLSQSFGCGTHSDVPPTGPTMPAVAAACVSEATSTIELVALQCICKMKRTIAPVDPENLAVGFSHAYESVAFGGMEGSSQDKEGGRYNVNTDDPKDMPFALDSRILFDNYTNFDNPWAAEADPSTYDYYDGGQAIETFTLAQWLAAAGVDLDTRNDLLAPDYRDDSNYPSLRVAGLKLNVEIEYSNANKDTQAPNFLGSIFEPIATGTHVHATMRVHADTKTWAGPVSP